MTDGHGADVRFSLAVVEPDNRARGRLVRLLRDALDVEAYPSIAALEEKADLVAPWVVVLGPSYADDTGLKETQVLVRDRPEVGVVMVVEELTTEVLRQALRSGVRDVLARPRQEELLEAVERVTATSGGRPIAAARGPVGDRGRLVTVVATKGGVGKSVVATNLAVALARSSAEPVALVDADLQFGDAALMLGVAPERTIVDVTTVMRRLDPEVLQRLLVRHQPSGLLVLPAPVEPAFADQVGAADVVRIVNVLQTFCGHVVVDTASQLNDVVLALAEESDDILLVCPLEMPSVKNAKLAVQTLRLLNVPLSKVRLVLKASAGRTRLDPREVASALQLKPEAEVPDDGAVPTSVNEAVPVVLGAPRSAAAKSLQRLARLLSGEVAGRAT